MKFNSMNSLKRVDERLIKLFTYIPLTTVEIECSFSIKNVIITNRRFNLSENSIKMLNICHWMRNWLTLFVFFVLLSEKNKGSQVWV